MPGGCRGDPISPGRLKGVPGDGGCAGRRRVVETKYRSQAKQLLAGNRTAGKFLRKRRRGRPSWPPERRARRLSEGPEEIFGLPKFPLEPRARLSQEFRAAHPGRHRLSWPPERRARRLRCLIPGCRPARRTVAFRPEGNPHGRLQGVPGG